MKAMILTAGEGRRLAPLTKRLPKPLFPVGDRSPLLYLFDLLREYGIKDVVLNLHHRGEEIVRYLEENNHPGTRITYSQEDKLLGTGGGIRNAQHFWEGEDVLVVNGDNLLDLNLEKLLQQHRAKGAVATMAVRPLKAGSSYTPIHLNEKSLVKTIGGKGAGPAYAFIGVQILRPEFFDALPAKGPAHLIEDGYSKLLHSRKKIAAYVTTGYWKEFSTFDLYWEANLDFLRGRSPAYYYRGRENFTRRGIHSGKDSRTGRRNRFYYPVYLGRNSTIGGGSTLGPLVMVGAGAVIGEDCRLENVVIWPNSKIRKGSRLKNVIMTPFGKVKIKS